ncbi:MAG TPA: hypothetical protein VFH06_01820 [Candidatus Saccharimonadales bacterium]|nr:hypothetical protein [Candidatus Saccharimonadales bacterium]
MSNPATRYTVVSLLLGNHGNEATCSSLDEARKFLEEKTEDGSSFGVLYYENGERPAELLLVAKLVDNKIHLDEVKLNDRRQFILQEEDGKLRIVAE